MRILSQGESLAEKIIQLRANISRPVYLSACTRGSGAGISYYTFPGNTNGPVRLTSLQLYLSPGLPKEIGKIIKRINVGSGMTSRVLSFPVYDIVESNKLKIIFPIKDSERACFPDKAFRTINIKHGESSTIFVDNKEDIPKEFADYVSEIAYRSNAKIDFAESEVILKPEKVVAGWFLNCFDKYSLFQPPGQYPTEEWVSSNESFNRFAMADFEPGGCMVCHGASKDQTHFCVANENSTYYSYHKYDANSFKLLICKSCARGTFTDWLNYLENFS